MTIRSFWSFGMALGLLLATGCGSDPGGTTGTKDRGTGGGNHDGSSWYNGLEPGSWPPPAEGGSSSTDGVKSREGGSKNDNGTACPAPSGSCSTACKPDETCTLVRSVSTCIKTLELVGKAGDKATMAPLAQAFVDCWNTQANGMCSSLKTCRPVGHDRRYS